MTREGVRLLAARVGKPTTDVFENSIGGNKFYKVKLKIPIGTALQQVVKVNHPILGPFLAYLTYERISRLCIFCAKLGHEMENCHDRIRMKRLKTDPRYRDRPEMQSITDPKVGLWITNNALIPLD